MYQLRPYQKEAVDSALNHFRKSNDPAAIVLPTGAGKSLVIAQLAKLAKGRVLALAHVKELVEQNHGKYQAYGMEAGIYSAGLGKKDFSQKVIFGSIQSVARAPEDFFQGFTLLIIDECHRVSMENGSQYQQVITKLKEHCPGLCILGLTATPYRLGLGWIYEHSTSGEIKSEQERFFKSCVYELPLGHMIKNGYLTAPVKIDIPVTSYDFSDLSEKNRMYTLGEVEELLKNQKRLTPLIVNNIVDIAQRYRRQGVMIFAATVRHAKEIYQCLPEGEARMIFGDTPPEERDQTIQEFKQRRFTYLVNVSVLTTGFDAPHVDAIAIMRPTESAGLYQQIVGRGLRLSEAKTDCFILDYTGMGHDIYAPEIGEKKPCKESVPAPVDCPSCGHVNTFWAKLDEDGNILEHYGRKCKGASFDSSGKPIPCGFRFRYKLCHACGEENDIAARACGSCFAALVDADAKLRQARLSKKAHVLRPDTVELVERFDKNSRPYLEARYYDCDAQYVSEFHFLSSRQGLQRFRVDFLRSHLRRPEMELDIKTPQDVIRHQSKFRAPAFIIARKHDKFWKVTEKIFSEELSRSYDWPGQH